MKSLDPRVSRLPEVTLGNYPVNPTDQLNSFEVFVQPRLGKSFQHEGSIRASDLELAFILAKETFTRRFTCVALWVTPTDSISVSDFTEGTESIYQQMKPTSATTENDHAFEIFEMPKRGKQHLHIGRVNASSGAEALGKAAGLQKPDAQACNLWAIPCDAIRYTTEEEKNLWLTLPEKKFRDATEYKGGEKLKNFLDRQTSN